jgi:hypothetical protein
MLFFVVFELFFKFGLFDVEGEESLFFFLAIGFHQYLLIWLSMDRVWYRGKLFLIEK